MSRILGLLSAVVLLLFALAWIWIGLELLGFEPTEENPRVTFTDAQVTVAGFLASAVGAGTASVLGIEIQKAAVQQTFGATLNEVARNTPLLMAGIAVYALVGVFILAVWFFESESAADLIGAFALGVLGWLAGAFAAVFRKS